jgi:endonuclease YncB( thermonuclease family)
MSEFGREVAGGLKRLRRALRAGGRRRPIGAEAREALRNAILCGEMAVRMEGRGARDEGRSAKVERRHD